MARSTPYLVGGLAMVMATATARTLIAFRASQAEWRPVMPNIAVKGFTEAGSSALLG